MRWASSRLAIAAALGAGAAACSTEATPGGGLLVVMSVDPSLNRTHPNRLSVDIGSTDGTTIYRDAGYPIDDASAGNVRFPTSLGIDSNGDPNAGVAMVLGIWEGTQPLDVERYQIQNIPTTRVAELPVDFGSSCGASGPADGGPNACPLETWGCTWDVDLWMCDARILPGPGADAGWPSPSTGDAAHDATVDEVPDATVADAAPGDAGDEADVAAEADDEADAPLTIACDAPCDPKSECVDGQCVPVPPSCSSGGPGTGHNCGPSGDDCCASDPVASGAFYRDYDGIYAVDKSHPASVSQFRLDRYEVTVGRFRAFVNAVSADDASVWTPADSSGRHTYLNGGSGLSNGGDGAPIYETGWIAATWDAYLPRTQADWDTDLKSCAEEAGTSTWSSAAGSDENFPINCVNWYEAYAFCIWDGAFLPSAAEWDYAAAGGARQSEYPWGNAVPGSNANHAVYGCFYPPLPSGSYSCTDGAEHVAPVGSATLGRGPWGQWDLAGNVFEWTLDYAPSSYPLPCVDCAETFSGTQRGSRGGAFHTTAVWLLNSETSLTPPAFHVDQAGVRCARHP